MIKAYMPFLLFSLKILQSSSISFKSYSITLRNMEMQTRSVERRVQNVNSTTVQDDGVALRSQSWTSHTPVKKSKNNVSDIVPTASVTPPSQVSPSYPAPAKRLTVNDHTSDENVILSLSTDCVLATLLCRPSKRNKSPYVADVHVPSLKRDAICHVPNLDMGGKCVPGVSLWVKPQRDSKTGQLIGPNAVNPKYGTPKCEFVLQLVRVDERWITNETKDGGCKGGGEKQVEKPEPYFPVWVGGHPSLGEQIPKKLIQRHIERGGGVLDGIGKIESYQKQVKISPNSRADFVLKPVTSLKDNQRQRIVEVKTVVDTDYNPKWGLPSLTNLKCVFKVPIGAKYDKYGIFPWGQGNQKGPDGEAVVSARAIKHVRELTSLVQQTKRRGKKQQGQNETKIITTKQRGKSNDSEQCSTDANYTNDKYDATILFIVIRHDAQAFRPNHEACPSFCKYLKLAQESGVQLLAKRVRWGEEEQNERGLCMDDGKFLDIEFFA